MLTETTLRHTIAHELQGYEAYSEAHINGLLRGLIWALNGKDPGTGITTHMNTIEVLELAGIPYRDDKTNAQVIFDNGDGEWERVAAEFDAQEPKNET